MAERYADPKVRAPVYQRRVDPFTGGIQAPRLPAVSGLAIGAEALAGALQQTARAGEVLGAAEMRRLDLEGAAYDNRALARLEADARAKLRELEESAEPGASEHAKRFGEWYGERRSAVLEAAPKGYDRSRLTAELDGLQGDLIDRADGFERKARVEYQISNHGDAHGDRRRMTLADPSLYGRMVEQTRASFAALDMPPIVAAKLEREALAELAGDRIEGLIFRQPAAALAELDQGAAPEIDPDRRASLMHRARAAVEDQQRTALAAGEKAARRAGEATGERIFGLGVDGPAGGDATPGTGRRASLGAMLAQARKIEDPIARQAAEGRVRELFGADELARKDAERTARETAYRLIEDGGRVVDLPDEVVAALDPTAIAGLEARMREKTARVQPVTDPALLLHIEGLTSQELADYDMLAARRFLDDKDFDRLVARQGAARRGEGGGVDDLLSPAAQVNLEADRLGLEDEKRAAFIIGGHRALDEHQRRTGKPLDFQEIRKVLDGLTLEGTTGSKWLGMRSVRARAFEAAQDSFLEFTADDLEEQSVELSSALEIPESRLDELAGLVQAAGVKVTRETLLLADALLADGKPVNRATLEAAWEDSPDYKGKPRPSAGPERTMPKPADGASNGVWAEEIAP